MRKTTLRRKILPLLLGLAGLAALIAFALHEPEQLVATGQASRGALEVGFTEEGKTRLKQRYAIAAPVAGTLRRIALQPGDAVQAGQVLAEIEPGAATLLDARTRSQAEADLRGAEAALAAVRQRTAAARTAEQLARTELARLGPLQAAGAVSREQFDRATAQAQTSRAELAAAHAEEGVAQQRVQSARALLAQVRNGAATDAGDVVLPVTAPIDGRVLRRPLESSTPVAPGQALMEIGDPEHLEIEVEVLSADAVRLAAGMPARIQRWGGEATLQATITRIEPGGFTKVSALGVEEQRTRVLLDFDSPREQWAALGDAFRVEVEFITRQEADVLQVPGSALFRSQGGWAVYRVEDGRARRTEVQIGLRSATAAQVLQGLEEGDTVVIQPDDQIHDGSRVGGGTAQ